MNKNRNILAIAALTALLSACATTPAPQASQEDAAGAAPIVHHDLALAPPALPDASNLTQLPRLSGQAITLPGFRAQDVSPNASIVGLKILILCADAASDTDLPPAKAMLDSAGIPYDVVDPTMSGGTLTSSQLVNADGSGKYQGIVLTTGALSYETSPGNFASALDYAGWQNLFTYERDYKVRQLSMYLYPSTWPEDYGLRDAGIPSSSATVSPTAAATASVLTDLKPTASIAITNAYNYPSTVTAVPGVTTTPLLTDASGNILAATSTTADGRERLALTFAQNQYMLGTQLLGYGLVNWLTKGVYLGEYRRYNKLDADDWFLDGDKYNANTGQVEDSVFRLSPQSARDLVNQQADLRSRFPVASEFQFSIAFNGCGAVLNPDQNCSEHYTDAAALVAATKEIRNDFDWVSHTFDHPYMDFLNYSQSYAQLSKNLSLGRQLGLKMSTRSLVSGDNSGLGWYNPNGDGLKTDHGLGASNKNFLRAAQAANVVYIASNHSVPSQWDASCSTCGVIHPLNAAIFLVPRWPVNIAYHTTTPEEETAWYNSVYGPSGTAHYWDHNFSYQEILNEESNLALSHVLAGGAFPHFIHVDNFNEYTSGRSLAYDWQEALLTKYSSYSTLPLKTLRWDDLGAYMRARTTYMKSGASGTWNRATNKVTVTTSKSATIFVTGAQGGSTSVYAGKTISQFGLNAGGRATLNVP